MEPVKGIQGEIYLPGSKSVSNRALLLSALAQGPTELINLLAADDVARMLEALKLLGVAYELSPDQTRCVVEGRGSSFNSPNPLELYLGNAGTAMRPLCAALCLGQGTFTLTGDSRMQERPIRDLVMALQSAGASIQYLKNEGYTPIEITAAGLPGGRLTVRGDISSQFLSALLLAAPLFTQDSIIAVEGTLVSIPYVDLTIALMSHYGAQVRHDQHREFYIQGNQTYRSPGRLLVEGDASAASYFFAAAAIKGQVRVHGLTRQSIQGDVLFVDVLEKLGATVRYGPDYIEVHQGPLRGLDIDCNHIPDAAMTLAVIALFAQGKTTIRNVANWRVKETDRLLAMATELRKVGAAVVEGPDYLEITPPPELNHAGIDTYHDHRIAMCFSLLSLAPCSVAIHDPDCVSKTFPDYFAKFAGICTK